MILECRALWSATFRSWPHDFDSTSPRLRAKASAPAESANDEQTHDFSINAEFETERFEPALSLEPLQDDVQLAESTSTPTDEDGQGISPTNKLQQEAPIADSDADPLLMTTADATLETSNGQTAVSANTIFEAGASGISRRVIFWALALGLAVIALLGISGLYYFQQTPTTRALPSPAASVEIERSREPVDTAKEEVVTSTKDNGSTPISAEAEVSEPTNLTQTAAAAVAESTSVGEKLPAADDKTDLPAADSLTSEGDTTKGAEFEQTKQTAQSTPQHREALTAAESSTSSIATSAPTVNTKRLKIAKSIRAAKSSEKVAEAYEAYRANEFTAARELYEQALAIRPQDTNALNGLAALALRENDKERAHEYYSKALKLDPNNATAKTAIFQIEGGVGNRVTESQLKLLLDEGGDPGAINFALGTLYSRHTRWNDAQLAFFEAVRHRPNNPDYLYNLAVSLDQIGQHQAAKDFYQQALAASDETSAGFNSSQVLSRIQSITSQSAASNTP